MRRTASLTVGGLVVGAGALLSAAPAAAQVVSCPPGQVAAGSEVVVCVPTGTPVQGGTGGAGTGGAGTGGGNVATGGGGAVSSPATLPFTGDEVLVMSALGTAALAVGAGFVVAGRRRATDAA